MRNKATYSLFLAAALIHGLAQQKEKAGARDMFHSAAGLVVPAKPAKPKAGPAAQPPQAATPPPSDYVTPALGLRYSILKEVSAGQTAEVDPATVFRSGDRIRLAIQTNDTASLYIIQRGSSGNWSVLFPSPEISGGDNVVEQGRKYEIPAGHWFAFDEQPGDEKLFLVLSRGPEPDLEKMIYTLREGENRPSKVLHSQNIRPISDSLVHKIRSQVYARDLVFEKVNESAAGEQAEKAVYVVNRTGSADSRIVADLTLSHR